MLVPAGLGRSAFLPSLRPPFCSRPVWGALRAGAGVVLPSGRSVVLHSGGVAPRGARFLAGVVLRLRVGRVLCWCSRAPACSFRVVAPCSLLAFVRCAPRPRLNSGRLRLPRRLSAVPRVRPAFAVAPLRPRRLLVRRRVCSAAPAVSARAWGIYVCICRFLLRLYVCICTCTAGVYVCKPSGSRRVTPRPSPPAVK